MGILAKEKRILKNNPPEIFVNDLGDNAVIIIIRYWTKYEDLQSVKSELLETIYKELPARKINFPFQQVDVRLLK